jgi:hypothetical protein
LLTLLPPRHCLYEATATAAPEEEGPAEGAEERDERNTESDMGAADEQTVARRREERERRKAEGERRQEAAESLASAHGVSILVANKYLARHGGSEERASAALERVQDRTMAGNDDDLA